MNLKQYHLYLTKIPTLKLIKEKKRKFKIRLVPNLYPFQRQTQFVSQSVIKFRW